MTPMVSRFFFPSKALIMGANKITHGVLIWNCAWAPMAMRRDANTAIVDFILA